MADVMIGRERKGRSSDSSLFFSCHIDNGEIGLNVS